MCTFIYCFIIYFCVVLGNNLQMDVSHVHTHQHYFTNCFWSTSVWKTFFFFLSTLQQVGSVIALKTKIIKVLYLLHIAWLWNSKFAVQLSTRVHACFRTCSVPQWSQWNRCWRTVTLRRRMWMRLCWLVAPHASQRFSSWSRSSSMERLAFCVLIAFVRTWHTSGEACSLEMSQANFWLMWKRMWVLQGDQCFYCANWLNISLVNKINIAIFLTHHKCKTLLGGTTLSFACSYHWCLKGGLSNFVWL